MVEWASVWTTATTNMRAELPESGMARSVWAGRSVTTAPKFL